MPRTASDAERHTHKATTWELKELWAKGSDLDAKITPPGVVIAREFTTHLMGEAFDAVQQALGTSGTPRIYEDVEVRIIKAARSGERDPDRLVDAGLEWWRHNRSPV